MPFSGKIGDLPIADLLQYLHAGQKSGTIILTRGIQKAYVYLHKGNIVHAVNPDRSNIGDLLLENRDITLKILQKALVHQSSQSKHMAIGQILIEMGAITQGRLKEVILNQIKLVISGLVTWMKGDFTFEPNEMIPVDDINLNPTSVLPMSNVNTQHLLLETARLLDEKDRAKGNRPTPAEPTPATDTQSRDTQPPPLPRRKTVQTEEKAAKIPASKQTKVPIAKEPPLPPHYSREEFESRWKVGQRKLVLLLTEDGILKNLLREVLRDKGLYVATPTTMEECLEKTRQYLNREVVPVILVDDSLHKVGRAGQSAAITILAKKKEARWTVPVVVMVGPKNSDSFLKLYQGGARSVLQKPVRDDPTMKDYPEEVKSLGSVVVALIQHLDGESEHIEESAGLELLKSRRELHRTTEKDQYLRLQGILKTVSDSVERAILFIVQSDEIVVLECFGNTMDGTPLKTSLKDITISLNQRSLFGQCVKEGVPYQGKIKPGYLTKGFQDRIGIPTSKECILLPVQADGRVGGLLYCDQGRLDVTLDHINLI